MKNRINTSLSALAVLLCCGALTASAQAVSVQDASVQSLSGLKVSGATLTHTPEDSLSVLMTLDLSEVRPSSNRAVVLTPYVVHGTDSVELPSVGIYGRNRYLYYVREGKSQLTGASEHSFRVKDCPSSLPYTASVPYTGWMDGSELKITSRIYGCCSDILDEGSNLLAFYTEPVKEIIWAPDLAYITPAAETVKSRDLQGRAYIDFPVNVTEIRADYRGNAVELAKIRATIDSVRQDKDITLTSLSIKGFASPEGSYAANERLARGRTLSLKSHVEKLYAFPKDFIKTSWEAEDWAGLREYVAGSSLKNRDAILAIIDGDLKPDAKEWKIRSTYPADYRTLLAEVYPGLRHSDYRVDYVIRQFSDVEEIRRLVVSDPQKLSLNEFYIAAQSYEAGSEDFIRVMETAVKVYPDDAVANLNAANAALLRKDAESAARYLQKAGNGPEAGKARKALEELRALGEN